MAWMDDRVWCHPKFTDLSDRAWRAYWNAVAYSSGMNTSGVLSPAQQQLLGATKKVREELVKTELWDEVADGVRIHDWDDHNGKRDARKTADRLRKRAARAADRSGHSAGRPQDSRQDVHTLKEVKVVTTPISPSTIISKACPDCGETYGAGHLESCPRMPAVTA